ncbi:MAG: class I SAM-dependent methyltransferase [Thermodesulfobacteriota bacterium]|nr:class I SAM-dependent methyltransferase [Thermodesulfobacteriota bacterium]
MHFEIHFPRMPLWKGVGVRPVTPEFYPYGLGWNEQGYIYQTTPKDVQQKVVESYSGDDYEFPSTPPGHSAWGDSRGDSAIEFIRSVFGSFSGAAVLDIGGGTTYMAEKLVARDGVAEYTIMDPSVRGASPLPQIKILREYFTGRTCPEKDFDLIVSLNCLEHVSDPVDFLCSVSRLLKRKNGKAVLFFPNNENQLMNGDFNAVLHEHITYFTKEVVENFAAICGLNIIEAVTRADLFCCCFEWGEKDPHKVKDLNKVIIKSADAFVNSLDYFNNLITSFVESDQKIAFHGACNGLNNVLSFCDFRNNDFLENITIFDGDEKKFGKYLPMCPNNPIVGSMYSKYKTMDQVIVSAMTFYDPIKKFLISQHGIKPERIHPLYPMKND